MGDICTFIPPMSPTGIHIAVAVTADGLVDRHHLDPIARRDYDRNTWVRGLFTMTRPRWPNDGGNQAGQ